MGKNKSAVVKAFIASRGKSFKFNKYIGRGFAQEEMELLVPTIETLLRDACAKPKDGGDWVEFVSLERLRPSEELEDTLLTAVNNTIFDITKSDFVKYKYTFISHSKGFKRTIVKKQFLPAINWRDSSIRVSNTKWYLAPVLTDPKLAPLPNGIGLFSKLYKNKSTIMSKGHIFRFNGKRALKTFIEFTNFYSLNKIDKSIDRNLENLVPPLVCFLFIKENIIDALRNKMNATYGEDFTIMRGKIEKKEGYDYIESIKEQHPDIRDPFPDRHNFHIRIKEGSKRLLYEIGFALIYTFDSGPDLAERYMEAFGTKYENDAFRLLLGRVTFKGAFDDVYTLETLFEHMRKVDTYIDTLTTRDLKSSGIIANNIEEYIMEIVRVYPLLTIGGQDYSKVVRDKKYEVLYYVLYGLFNKINKSIDDINRGIYFNGEYSDKHIDQKFKEAFKVRDFFNISKGGSQILPLTLFNTTRDNLIYGITTVVEVQERGAGPFKASARKGSGGSFPSTLKSVTGADAVRSSNKYIPKPAPSGRLRASPFGIWENGNYVYTPEIIELMDDIDNKLSAYRDEAISETALEAMGTIEEVEG